MNTETIFSASFRGNTAHICRRPIHNVRKRGSLQVQGALSRKRKEEIVAVLKTKLEDAVMVFSLPCKGLSVAQMEKFRNGIKATNASVYMCKNSLMLKACEEVEGWDEMKNMAQGDNAWVFATESQIAPAVRAWLSFEEEQLKEANAGLAKASQVENVTSLRGGILQGKLLDSKEVQDLQDLPTLEESYAKIGSLLKAIPTRLGMSIKQIPQKVAISLKKVSELDENKDALVGSFAKDAPA